MFLWLLTLKTERVSSRCFFIFYYVMFRVCVCVACSSFVVNLSSLIDQLKGHRLHRGGVNCKGHCDQSLARDVHVLEHLLHLTLLQLMLLLLMLLAAVNASLGL